MITKAQLALLEHVERGCTEQGAEEACGRINVRRALFHHNTIERGPNSMLRLTSVGEKTLAAARELAKV